MIFKLKCKDCGTLIEYDTTANYKDYVKCFKCGNTIDMNIETKLNSIAELEHFEILWTQKSFIENVFNSDILDIKNLYENSSQERKEIISNIFDRFLLLLNQNSEETDKLLSEFLKNQIGKRLSETFINQ